MKKKLIRFLIGFSIGFICSSIITEEPVVKASYQDGFDDGTQWIRTSIYLTDSIKRHNELDPYMLEAISIMQRRKYASIKKK